MPVALLLSCCAAAALIVGTPGSSAALPFNSDIEVGRAAQQLAPPATTPRHPFLLCPVDPPVSYYDDFGEARYVGGFHHHAGIDMMAAEGTRVRAPFDGVATQSESWAGGLTVQIEGPLGYVYDIHLSAFGKQGKVRAGDIVGYVGSTGDAQGHSPHNHFEWHPGGGPAVDAFRFLNQVCRAPKPIPAESVRLAV